MDSAGRQTRRTTRTQAKRVGGGPAMQDLARPGCSSWSDHGLAGDGALMPPPRPLASDEDSPEPLPWASSPEEHLLTWAFTPDEVLITVFKHLGDRDRCRAARVCRKWLQVFRTACLWRRRRFRFRGHDAMEELRKYKIFISRLGQHVQHIVLDLDRPNMTSAGVIAKAFEGFVSQVNSKSRMRLLSITARSMDFQNVWRFFSHHRGKVVKSLCTLLRHQFSLRTADLSFCRMNKDEGLRVLEALSLAGCPRRHHHHHHHQHQQQQQQHQHHHNNYNYNYSYSYCHHKLARLDLQDFFTSRSRVLSSGKFAVTAGRFLALTTLCMDKRYLDEDVLEKLTSRPPDCAHLRYLQLVTDAGLDPVLDHFVSRQAWLQAVKCNPVLRVGVLFVGFTSFDHFPSVLVRGMPLSLLSVTCLSVFSPVPRPADMEQLFRDLASNYNTTLTCLQLCLWPGPVSPAVDDAMVGLVSRCHLLQELHVQCKTVPETLDKMEAALAKKAHSALQTLDLGILGMSDEMQTPEYLGQRWPCLSAMSGFKIAFL